MKRTSLTIRNLLWSLSVCVPFLFSDFAFSASGECSNPFKIKALARLRNADRGDLSKVMRSNPDFFFRSQITQQWILHSEWSQYKGFIYGDGHIGNLGPIYTEGRGEWGAIDLDDLGVGPLVLGLAKSILLGKVVTDDVKVKESVLAFVKGLTGKRHEIPEVVKDFQIHNKSEYIELIEDYMTRNTQYAPNDTVKIKKDEGMSTLSKSEYTKVEKVPVDAFSKVRVFDIVRYKKSYGGSKNALRYRALVEVNNHKMILDMKQALPSAISYVDPAYSHLKNVRLIVSRVYGTDLDLHKIVNWQSSIFIISPRYTVRHIEKIQDELNSETSEFVELSYYNLFIQGRDAQRFCTAVHSLDCQLLANAILKRFEEFIQMLKNELLHPSLDEFKSKIPE